MTSANNKARARALRLAPDVAMLTLAYPRLDIEVSTKRNHLLKAPFCVHPKTGIVCVPFAASAAAEFNPQKAPKLAGLMEEVDGMGTEVGGLLGGMRGGGLPAVVVVGGV